MSHSLVQGLVFGRMECLSTLGHPVETIVLPWLFLSCCVSGFGSVEFGSVEQKRTASGYVVTVLVRHSLVMLGQSTVNLVLLDHYEIRMETAIIDTTGKCKNGARTSPKRN
jgi:hypothetical protein